MNATLHRQGLLLCFGMAALVLLGGCGSSIVSALTGGGLPPGEPDIGGIVLQEAVATTASDAAQAVEIPVPGAEIRLMRGMRQVGTAVTGATGHFRFDAPPTGNYRAEVTPPAGMGLMATHREVRHQGGQQTFLRIVLDRE